MYTSTINKKLKIYLIQMSPNDIISWIDTGVYNPTYEKAVHYPPSSSNPHIIHGQ